MSFHLLKKLVHFRKKIKRRAMPKTKISIIMIIVTSIIKSKTSISQTLQYPFNRVCWVFYDSVCYYGVKMTWSVGLLKYCISIRLMRKTCQQNQLLSYLYTNCSLLLNVLMNTKSIEITKKQNCIKLHFWEKKPYN